MNIRFISILISMLLIAQSCGTSNKTRGAVIGGAVGATAGGLLTKNNRAVGIIIGAAVGGVTGGLIGRYMDNAAKKIENDLGKNATVTRIEEGIVVSFDSGLLFDFDSYAIKSATQSNLAKLANTLIDYPNTVVNILGHTDAKGAPAYNQTLSTNRAMEVKILLNSLNIPDNKIIAIGMGENDPIADNKTEEGRMLNRRVEVVITGDAELGEKLSNQ